LQKWNQEEDPYPVDKTLHVLFEEQVKRTPDAIALQYKDQKLTYKALNDRANRISAFLLACGVNHGDVIAVYLPRSFDFFAAILGSMKVNAGYLALDPNSPLKRLQFLLTDSLSIILMSNSNLIKRFENSFENVINVESLPHKPIKLNVRGPLYKD